MPVPFELQTVKNWFGQRIVKVNGDILQSIDGRSGGAGHSRS